MPDGKGIGEARPRQIDWHPPETAPRDAPFWAYDKSEGIRAVRWYSAEFFADKYGDTPDEWQAGFYLLGDDENEVAFEAWAHFDSLNVPA